MFVIFFSFDKSNSFYFLAISDCDFVHIPDLSRSLMIFPDFSRSFTVISSSVSTQGDPSLAASSTPSRLRAEQ